MICAACGAVNGASARYCDQCGTPLREHGSRAAADRSNLGREPASGPDDIGPGDRRIVTALFADLVDYSRLVAELDPEEVRRRVDDALTVMAEAVRRFDGSIEKFIGDAVFAVFGVPRAHDDDPIRAALCALAIRAGLADRAREAGDETLEVRVGLATGEVLAAPRQVAGDRGWGLTGGAVTMAARLQQLADPGEIILDEATVRASRGRLDTEPIGSRPVRGHPEPLRLYRLVAERPHGLIGPRSRGLLVGRTAERRRLREALETTARTGRGHAVVLVGEAGIGKSRLIADVEEEARALGFAWMWTENASYGVGLPYGYARTFSERLAEEHGLDAGSAIRRLLFTGDVPPAEIRQMAGAIAGIARDASIGGWEAEADLAPVDPAEMVASLRAVVRRLAPSLVAAGGPRVIVIDDLHWADQSSLPLIEAMIRASAELPIVFLVATRGPVPPWAELPHAESIELVGLSSEETERLAAAVAGAELVPDDARRVHERTGGNPLFVAETVRALIEDGSLVRHGRRLRLVGGGRGLSVPVNLRALIGARIDQLPPTSRSLLQVASTIGIGFSTTLVETLLEARVEATAIDVAADAALIVPGETEGAWRFRHPLIHDVAYASLLSSRRRALHARLADHFEATEGYRALEQLAHHRTAAGDAERAIPLLAQAAERALASGAAVEAGRYWMTAAELADGSTADDYRARAHRALGSGAGDRADDAVRLGREGQEPAQ